MNKNGNKSAGNGLLVVAQFSYLKIFVESYLKCEIQKITQFHRTRENGGCLER